MSSLQIRRMTAAIASMVLLFCLFGCASAPASSSSSASADSASVSASAASSEGSGDVVEVSGDITDETFNKDVDDAELHVFQFDGECLTVKNCYSVGIASDEPLEDGKFYKVIADVTFLNGGIAGYVEFPDVKRVKSCVEESPFDLGLPTVEETPYGLAVIGNYADGDLLLNEGRAMAVWKDGSWVYRYDDELKLNDGGKALVRKGMTADDVQAGIAGGVLSCEDYFVLPSQG